MDRQVAPVLSLAKYLRNWRLPGVNTIISLLTFLGFLLGNWNEIPAFSSLWQPLTRRFTASVTLETDDKLTKEVRDWLVAHVLKPRNARFWVAHTNLSAVEQRRENEYSGRSYETRNFERDEGIRLLPENRSTWFMFNRRLFVVHQKAAYSPPSYSWASAEEALRIDCLGRSVDPILDFLEACREFSRKSGETFVPVHTAVYGRWQESALKRARPLETIYLAHDLKQSLVEDIREYLEPQTSQFYAECGIPYRRGYLLHGPPGTGKTSLCIAIAGLTKLPLYILRLPGLDGDKELDELFNSLPSRCVVLMEDIDAIQMERLGQKKKSKRGKGKGKKKKKRKESGDDDGAAQPSCTLSGVLNVLDGVASQEGRVVIMTANQPELLDKALTRPGRIDRKFYLGNMSPANARDMFKRILRKANNTGSAKSAPGALSYPGAKGTVREEAKLDRLADDFSRAIPDALFSPAQIQEYLLSHRDDAALAVRSAPKWVAQEMAAMALAEKEAKQEEESESESDEDDEETGQQKKEKLEEQKKELITDGSESVKEKKSVETLEAIPEADESREDDADQYVDSSDEETKLARRPSNRLRRISSRKLTDSF